MSKRPDPSKTIATRAKQYLINRYGASRCHFATSHRRQIGPNRFINAKEDLFGVADAICLGPFGAHLWQWTSVGGATARKRKIEAWRAERPIPGIELTVIGYEPRKGFRVWLYLPKDGKWWRGADIPLSACKKP